MESVEYYLKKEKQAWLQCMKLTDVIYKQRAALIKAKEVLSFASDNEVHRYKYIEKIMDQVQEAIDDNGERPDDYVFSGTTNPYLDK